jgi:hypothetical protein
MRRKSSLTVLAVVAMLVGSAGLAHAAIDWSVPNGGNSNFDYANGQTDFGLFVKPGTSPIVSSTGLLFFPENFKASAAGGSAEQVSDVLKFEIHVKPGKELSQFIVHEFGDYTLLNSGPNTAVKAFGGLFLVNMDTFEVLEDTLDTVPAPLAGVNGLTSGQGAWTGDESILSIPPNWTNIQVILNNVLAAGSDPGTTSFIQKKVGDIGVQIILVIPEPGTLSLGLIAGALLLARRGRRLA